MRQIQALQVVALSQQCNVRDSLLLQPQLGAVAKRLPIRIRSLHKRAIEHNHGRTLKFKSDVQFKSRIEEDDSIQPIKKKLLPCLNWSIC